MNEELNEPVCIYFIENHISTCSPAMSVSSYYGGILGELEKEKEKEYLVPESNEKFIYSIYHFELNLEKIREIKKDNLQIKLIIENENQKFEHKMTIIDLNRNNYIFDLVFEKKGIIHHTYPPKSYKFTRCKQYEIYCDYLKNDLGLKKNDNKKREDLVFSARKFFEQKFMFNFYIIVFVDCAFSKIFKSHFHYFDLHKIEENGDISNQKLSKRYIDTIIRRPDIILSDFKDKKEKEDNGIRIFSFFLYFYYVYIRNDFPKILENKDETIKYYINNVLLNYSDFFFEQKLSKERVQELIDISQTYIQLTNSLQYIKTISELLDIIESNFQKFKKLYKADKNKKTIDIEKIIFPSKEDDMKKICEKYIKLIDMQDNEMKAIFIYMRGSLIDKYINFFEKVNIDYLFNINDIINKTEITIIKYKHINKAEIEREKDINKIIFDTGLTLAKEGKMTNLKIIDSIIQRLIDNNQVKESLEIIPELKIGSFDKNFYDRWEKINWIKKFENDDKLFSLFTDKVLGLVTNLKDFDVLFYLLKITSESDKEEIKPSSLEKMQKKFIELYNDYDFLKN